MLLISNRAPADWCPLFPNPVAGESLLDRVINSSHHLLLEGKSSRPTRRPTRHVRGTGRLVVPFCALGCTGRGTTACPDGPRARNWQPPALYGWAGEAKGDGTEGGGGEAAATGRQLWLRPVGARLGLYLGTVAARPCAAGNNPPTRMEPLRSPVGATPSPTMASCAAYAPHHGLRAARFLLASSGETASGPRL
jgi:hypothetical protein